MTLLAAALLFRQETLPPANQLLSQAIRNYATTSSLEATVETEAVSGQTKVKVHTDLLYRKPNQFYLRQIKSVEGPVDRNSSFQSALVISDGSQIAYDHPEPLKRSRGERVFERAKTAADRPYDLASLYTVSRGSMIDSNVAFDFLIFDKAIHESLPARFSRLRTLAQTKVDGKSAYIVEGFYQQDTFGETPIRLTIDEQGNLYSILYSLTFETARAPETVQLSHRVRSAINPANLDKTKFDIKRTR